MSSDTPTSQPVQLFQKTVISTTDLIRNVARSLVDSPESVLVNALAKDGKIVLSLAVSESDLGKVIGRQGRTARSIRIILRAVTVKTGIAVELDILALAAQNLK